MLLTDAIEDVTTDKSPIVVRKAQTIFDWVRLDSLSRTQSLELITKVVKQCKP